MKSGEECPNRRDTANNDIPAARDSEPQVWRRSCSRTFPTPALRATFDRGKPWPEEVRKANALAWDWACHGFDEKEAQPWVKIHREIAPRTARALAQAGLRASDAAQRIWNAMPDRSRPRLAQRVARGNLTAEQAKEELRRAIYLHAPERSSPSETPPFRLIRPEPRRTAVNR